MDDLLGSRRTQERDEILDRVNKMLLFKKTG